MGAEVGKWKNRVKRARSNINSTEGSMGNSNKNSLPHNSIKYNYQPDDRSFYNFA